MSLLQQLVREIEELTAKADEEPSEEWWPHPDHRQDVCEAILQLDKPDPQEFSLFVDDDPDMLLAARNSLLVASKGVLINLNKLTREVQDFEICYKSELDERVDLLEAFRSLSSLLETKITAAQADLLQGDHGKGWEYRDGDWHERDLNEGELTAASVHYPRKID